MYGWARERTHPWRSEWFSAFPQFRIREWTAAEVPVWVSDRENRAEAFLASLKIYVFESRIYQKKEVSYGHYWSRNHRNNKEMTDSIFRRKELHTWLTRLVMEKIGKTMEIIDGELEEKYKGKGYWVECRDKKIHPVCIRRTGLSAPADESGRETQCISIR